ncbi:hypothetical protein ILYODFUR_037647, partial [Ilyodon furcidens]
LFFFLHLGLTAAAVFLKVTPNRQQFFTGESVHLSCEEEEDGKSADGWTLKRVREHQTETFGVDKVFQKCSGATYTVPALSAAERGVYWCEDPRGNKTIKVTLTVSDVPFIMEIPALPVILGSNVTIRCRDRNGSSVSVHFFKFKQHREPIRAAPDGQFRIINVQKSDEGLYWCSFGQRTSVSSMLHVRG